MAAYNLLTNWKQDPRNMVCLVSAGSNGVAFAHLNEDGEEGEAALVNNDGGKHCKSQPTCHKCGKKGHISPQCKQEDSANKDD
jgi:hypothetical protein